LRAFIVVALAAGSGATVAAQESETTREAVIEQAQAEKVKTLHAYEPAKAERLISRLEARYTGSALRWHAFFDNAYSGGGFSPGIGYGLTLSSYNTLDVRGSYSIKGYKRAEAEFVAPRLFQRRGALTLVAGWREATQVGFYGLGMNTSKDDRVNYLFSQPFGSALLTVRPTRRLFVMRGGLELSRWSQQPGGGVAPSVETKYTPQTLPGLGSRITYLHTQGTVGLDWRTSPGYTRRGGFYGVTVHDYADRDDTFGFRQVDYEIVQHVPILREAWVVSLHGLAQVASSKTGQQIPFFMLPSVGGGHSLRGFSSWRFRDRNSLALQAEWRIVNNRYFETAFFYEAGKVAARKSDLDLDGLKSDYGVGFRFHGPVATPLRIELARSNEGLSLVFATSAAF
jgi:hypothetical protein